MRVHAPAQIQNERARFGRRRINARRIRLRSPESGLLRDAVALPGASVRTPITAHRCARRRTWPRIPIPLYNVDAEAQSDPEPSRHSRKPFVALPPEVQPYALKSQFAGSTGEVHVRRVACLPNSLRWANELFVITRVITRSGDTT
jgi:hypothetical protein